jgi:hypothetical protein
LYILDERRHRYIKVVTVEGWEWQKGNLLCAFRQWAWWENYNVELPRTQNSS